MKRLKVLVFAAATGRIGHVFLWGERLLDWGLSRRASRSPHDAAEHATKVISDLNPDVVVTEELSKSSTKGWKTRQLLDAIGAVALKTKLLDIRAKRPHDFPNKYEEAACLATRFPEIAAWVPKKRRLWESEPRATVLFEALALGLSVMAEN
jgi:hypothetical protein